MLLRNLTEIKMDLGSCFALFTAIALLLLLVLCLLLKCYSFQLIRKRQQAASRYQTTSHTSHEVQDDCYEGAYEEYCLAKASSKLELRQGLLEGEESIEMPLKRQITKLSHDFYGLSSLRQRLNKDTNQFDPFLGHQLIPLKELSFPRVNTTDRKLGSKSWRDTHEFVKRLICYQRQGITLFEVHAHSLSKSGENVMLKKKVEQTEVASGSPEFEMFLESLGLEMFGYSYSKVVCQVDISEAKDHATYSLKSLQTKEYKQDIGEEQYLRLIRNLKRE